ncbi:MAG: hypothetical protein SXV54_18755 [Chloroflexota bacterium]|nr:hypothetical protein [Chloroflexota bacterium]
MFRKTGGKFVRDLTIALTLIFIANAIAACAVGEPEETELERMLAYLPPVPEHPDFVEAGVSFSNPAELKRLHGFAEDATFENAPEDRGGEFSEVVASAGMCMGLASHIPSFRPQMDLGYNVMAVKRCIGGSGVTVIEGFDPHHVAANLEDRGYDVDEYGDVTTYHFNAENYTGDDRDRELAEMAGQVAVLEEAVIIAATTERLHAALDTRAGRADDLSSTSHYDALAQALGPVVNAVLFSIEEGPRQLMGIGYQEIAQQERYIFLASTHATTEEAQAEGEGLVENLEAHSLANRWQEIGEPTITDFEGGVVLTIALELKDRAPGGIPGELFLVWS